MRRLADNLACEPCGTIIGLYLCGGAGAPLLWLAGPSLCISSLIKGGPPLQGGGGGIPQGGKEKGGEDTVPTLGKVYSC